jgi:hypothetical protein
MAIIELAIEIRAPIERVFDLSRSIDCTSKQLPVQVKDRSLE